MSRPKAKPNWSAAVADVLGDRDAQREQPFDADADQVFDALEVLVRTGRCLATIAHGGYMPLTGICRTTQSRTGLNGRARQDVKDLKNMAIALEGSSGSWIANVARVTYLPPRRGAPAEKAVFHLLLGERHGSPFINDARIPEPQLHLASGAWVLLSEADLDMPSMLRGDVDPTDLDSLGEAVRGRARASYVPADERVRKEQGLAAVKAAYLSHRGPSPRALQQDDIDVIVRSGLESGLLINLDLVHAATDNRGSPNAVYPKLADAMRRLAPGRNTAEDIHPALVAVWDKLRAAALADADDLLAPQRASLEGERAALAAATEQLLAERAQDARAADERQRMHERLDQELARARDRIDSLANVELGHAQEISRLTAEREGLRTEVRALHGTVEEAQSDLATLRTTYAAQQEKLTKVQAEATAERNAGEALLAEARDRLSQVTLQAETSVTALGTANKKVDELRIALKETQRGAADYKRAQLAADRALSQQREHAEREHAERTTSEAALLARVEALTSETQSQARELAALGATHQAVLLERDRLDRLLGRLRPIKEA